MKKKTFVYATYVRASAERVWQALTSPEFTAQYFHATRVDSTWRVGDPVRYLMADTNELAVDGEVLVSEAPTRLVISWHVLYNAAASKEPPSRVSFEIEELSGQTRLTVTHDQFPDDTVVFDGIQQGWPWIIASLKSLLETGEALPPEAA